MLLLLCLLLLGKIESQVFLDALDGGVQVDLVAVVVKRSLMRYIINRGRADGRRAQLFDQGIPIAGQRVGGVGLLPVRDGLRQIGVFHIPLYREALVEGIQLHNGVCQHDLDKSFCQCGVGGVSRDGNDLFGLNAAAGQRPDGNGGVAPKQLQRVGTAAYVEVVERNNELAALRNYTTGAPVVAATTKSLQEGARVRTAG